MHPQTIITRRHLPHWYVPGAFHFVTYRVHGTFPLNVATWLKEKREALLQTRQPRDLELWEHRLRIHKQYFGYFDQCLDQDSTETCLSDPRVAAMIRENLYHHHGRLYHLLAYCVMPNHVHVLFQPIDHVPLQGQARLLVPTMAEWGEIEDKQSPLAKIMHSLKSYTANQANRILRRRGQFWQHESYDHWIRDEDELGRVVDYICWNPVKANHVKEPHDWYFSSAHDRYLKDGSKLGYLSV